MCEALEAYLEFFEERASKKEGFPGLEELGNQWRKLDKESREIYTDLLSDSLREIDEREMIASARKDFAQKGVLLKNNGPQLRKIQGLFGTVLYVRSSLVSVDRESAKNLFEMKQVKSVVPLDCLLGVDVLPFKMTVNLMCRAAMQAVRADSFQDAQESIFQLYGIHVGRTQIEDVTRFVGNCVVEDYRAMAEKAKGKPSLADERRRRRKEHDILYLLTDSEKICIRDKNGHASWMKSWYAAAIHSSNVKEYLDEKGEKRQKLRALEYIGYVGSAEEFQYHFLALAKRNQCDVCSQVVVVSDGAAWVANIVKEFLPKATQILDLFHARKNAVRFACYVIPEKEGNKFADELCSLLEEGKIDELLEKTRPYRGMCFSEDIPDFYTFVMNHKECMHYDEYKKAGVLLGSGAMESGNGILMRNRMRMPRSGWSLEGARRMLALKAKLASHKWTDVKKLVWAKLNSKEGIKTEY